jgi:hypothetical protein
MKLGNLYASPGACAQGIARKQHTLQLLTPLRGIRPNTPTVEAAPIVDNLEEQLYRQSFVALRYREQARDAHPVA